MLYGKFIQSKQVDKVAPFHDPLKTLKVKTLASDSVIKKDVTTMPLLIYYGELYMLHRCSSKTNELRDIDSI